MARPHAVYFSTLRIESAGLIVEMLVWGCR
jgi:hypothetical protein